jgi:hypothetical protein
MKPHLRFTAFASVVCALLCALSAPSCSISTISSDDHALSEDSGARDASGGDAGGRGDGGAPSDAAAVYPAPHPAPPQIVKQGGPVLAAPNFIPIFYPDDPLKNDTVAFLTAMTASTYWSTTTADYGVGAASLSSPVVLTEAAPTTIDDSAVQSWLGSQIAHNSAFGGPPTSNSFYVIVYPEGTTITRPNPFPSVPGSTIASCSFYAGYHSSFTLTDGTPIVYAVIPRCPGTPNFPGKSTALEQLTTTLSHELVEGSADPLMNAPAFTGADPDHLVWGQLFPGAEIADLCDPVADDILTLPGVPSPVQRIWSNSSALAGHDPCLPIPAGQVYFNAAPVLPDTWTAALGGHTFTTHSVSIAPGQSKAVEVDLFSDAPASPWMVIAAEFPIFLNPHLLSFTWGDQSCTTIANQHVCGARGANGDKHMLTISVAALDAGVNVPAQAFTLSSVDDSGKTTQYWVGLVSFDGAQAPDQDR